MGLALGRGRPSSAFDDNSPSATTSAKEKGEVFKPPLGYPFRPFDQSFGRQRVGAPVTVGTALAGLMARIEFLAIGELRGKILERLDFQCGCGVRIGQRLRANGPSPL